MFSKTCSIVMVCVLLVIYRLNMTYQGLHFFIYLQPRLAMKA